MNRRPSSGCEDSGRLENDLVAISVRGTEDATESQLLCLERGMYGDKGVLFRSVALRRIAPNMEDSREGKSID